MFDELSNARNPIKIPDKINTQHKRTPVTREAGSSLPTELRYKDSDGDNVKKVRKHQNAIGIEDMDVSIDDSGTEAEFLKEHQKMMRLGKETKRQNKFLSHI